MKHTEKRSHWSLPICHVNRVDQSEDTIVVYDCKGMICVAYILFCELYQSVPSFLVSNVQVLDCDVTQAKQFNRLYRFRERKSRQGWPILKQKDKYLQSAEKHRAQSNAPTPLPYQRHNGYLKNILQRVGQSEGGLTRGEDADRFVEPHLQVLVHRLGLRPEPVEDLGQVFQNIFEK